LVFIRIFLGKIEALRAALARKQGATKKCVPAWARTRDLGNKVERHVLLATKNKKTIYNIFFSTQSFPK
jgi:hypothetical protein